MRFSYYSMVNSCMIISFLMFSCNSRSSTTLYERREVESIPRYPLPRFCYFNPDETMGSRAARLAKEEDSANCPEGTLRVEKKSDGETERWCEGEKGKREGLHRKANKNYHKDTEYRNDVTVSETVYNWNTDGTLGREYKCEKTTGRCLETLFDPCGIPAAFSGDVNGAMDGWEVHWDDHGMISQMVAWSNSVLNGPWLTIQGEGWYISTGFFLGSAGTGRGFKHVGPSFEWLLPGCAYERVCQSDSPACHLCTGEYEDGKRVGRWTEWAANGRKKLAIYEYEDGKLVKEKKLD